MKILRSWGVFIACLGASLWSQADGGGITPGGEDQIVTTTTLSVPASPVSANSAIVLQASISPSGAVGTVQFSAGSQVLGTSPVATAAATLTLAPGTFTAGTYGIKAAFISGDSNYANSISASVGLTVTAPGGGTLPATPPTSPTPISNYEYDAEGNPTKTTVAPGTRNYATQHGYDELGRRTTTTDARNGLTNYGYDLQDHLTSVTDPRRLVTEYKPTGLGDVKQLTSPDTGTGTANSTFDAAGNLKTRTDARGVLATYSYDELNRATQVIYTRTGDASRTVGWTYDETGATFGYGKGRLTTATTPDASTTFRYDALGRVTNTVQTSAAGNPMVVGTGYDTTGHVTSLTYPSGRSVTFGWAAGQPTSVTITSGGVTTTLLDQAVMSPFGPVQSWVWKLGGTSRPHERVYDTSGRPVRQPLGLLVRDITYDDADRISRYTHYTAATAQPATAYDQVFGYDELDRLTTVMAATNWSYSYDANGNRTAAAAGTSARGYTVSTTSNRLDALTSPLRSMGYDDAGNTVSDVQSGASSNYTATYSLEGRLATMAQGSSVGLELGYDALGRRVTRGQWMGSPNNPKAYTLYAYDGANHLIGEYTANGTAVTEYVWFGDTPVAVIKPDASAPGGIQVYAIHADHLDTPRVMLDAQGNVRWRWMGEPFGANLAEEQPTTGLAAVQQSLRFPGQQFESFGGRHYNQFRDYDPTVGRYVQSDPIGLGGGINTYAYVGGNPLSYSDPTGQIAQALPLAVPAVIIGCAIWQPCKDAVKNALQHSGNSGSNSNSRSEPTTVEEFCSKCKATATRASAQAAAYVWAGLTPENTTPIPWKNNFNPPYGSGFKNGPVWADFFRTYNPPNYGGWSGNSSVEEHPFGHPDLPGGLNHDCPHFVATNSKGVSVEFPYRPGS